MVGILDVHIHMENMVMIISMNINTHISIATMVKNATMIITMGE
jgi:hypothetical protein